jgi:hypothetical protein
MVQAKVPLAEHLLRRMGRMGNACSTPKSSKMAGLLDL